MFAIVKTLETISNTPNTNYTIYTDSLSSLFTIQNIYPKNYLAQKIQEKLTELTNRDVHVKFVWIPGHKGLSGNEKADEAAKDIALNNQQQTEDHAIQIYDIIAQTKDQINSKWEEEWTHTVNNKLRSIKPTVTPWIPDRNRREQVIINRLRIGHCRATHSHLFERSDRPQCDTCNAIITVDHLLQNCTKYQRLRQTLDIPNTLKETLDNNQQTTDRLMIYQADSTFQSNTIKLYKYL